jgi:uncharacterized RDD family membrane protein YckC
MDFLQILNYSLAFFLLNAWLLITKGQTIGKMLTETKIVDLSGGRVPLWKIYIFREVIFWWPFSFMEFLNSWPLIIQNLYFFLLIFNGLFIFGESRRCIHDWICKTQVVDYK